MMEAVNTGSVRTMEAVKHVQRTIEVLPGRQLAQLRPANTTAASILQVGEQAVYAVTCIQVCNTSGSPSTYRIFHDADGTTYDQTTALYYDVAIAADTVDKLEWDDALFMDNENGNLAVRSGNGNALTFTVYGKEYDLGRSI